MRPALSIIVFTVSAGAGLGLLALAGLLNLAGEAVITARVARIAGATGLALMTLGLASSTLHLANPKNAWRAFSRVKTSWLSREAVCAVLLYPLAGIFLLGLGCAPGSVWTLAAGVGVALLALLTLFATGMIYAVLRTIPQWHSALVPLNFMLLGLASGALALVFITAASGAELTLVPVLSAGSVLLAALSKALYYLWLGSPQAGPTINTATGFTRAAVKLLDIGHSGGTFNTQEFGYCVQPERIKLARTVVVLLLLAPTGFSAIVWHTGSALAAALAFVSATLSLLLERWLFFAEARHSVNLFHGRQHLH